MNFLNKQREYLQIKCLLAIKKDNKRLKEMEMLQRYFLEQIKPNKFDPYDQDNVLMAAEMSFEDICNTMEDQGAMLPKNLTEFEFYNKMKFIQKKFKNHAAK